MGWEGASVRYVSPQRTQRAQRILGLDQAYSLGILLGPSGITEDLAQSPGRQRIIASMVMKDYSSPVFVSVDSVRPLAATPDKSVPFQRPN